MERNLDNRVEAVTPIRDPSLKARLEHVLETCLSDNRNAWELRPDSDYVQRISRDDEPERRAQAIFMREVIDAQPD